MHEYTECYLYYSCMMTECDPYIRGIWEECLQQELAHLHKAKELLWKYEKKDYQEVLGCDGTLPSILKLESNINYVRKVLETTVGNTQDKECVVPLGSLNKDHPFFFYQKTVNTPLDSVSTHCIIDRHIRCYGIDYRYEVAPNPVTQLQSRTHDNTALARVQEETPERLSRCGTTEANCRCNLNRIKN